MFSIHMKQLSFVGELNQICVRHTLPHIYKRKAGYECIVRVRAKEIRFIRNSKSHRNLLMYFMGNEKKTISALIPCII